MATKYKLKRTKEGVLVKKKENKDLTTATDINVFDLGPLLLFETHAWRAIKRLPKDVVKKISKQQQADWYRATKDLIDRKHLREMNSVITDARNYIWGISLPFPLPSAHFVPHDLQEEVNERLTEYQKKLDELKPEFRNKYNSYIKEAKKILEPDGLFNPHDYPDNVADLFYINWRFFEIIIPSQLPEALKQQEISEFNSLMLEARNKAVMALRESFGELVSDLHDTLTGKLDGEKKRMNQKKLDRIMEFLDNFKKRNVYNDGQLENLVVQATEMVQGLTKDELNKDEDLAGILRDEMGRIKSTLTGMTETYERKVSFS